jgi:hypothetical protein
MRLLWVTRGPFLAKLWPPFSVLYLALSLGFSSNLWPLFWQFWPLFGFCCGSSVYGFRWRYFQEFMVGAT